jgi:hypothetical protein
MVREVILGDNPFIGVSHLTQEKAKDEQADLPAIDMKINVIKAAMEGGATGFTFSTHQLNFELLQYMKKNYIDMLEKLNYYILAPYAQGYVRQANALGTARLIKFVLRNIILENPVDFLSSTAKMSIDKIAGLFIAVEIRPYLRILPEERVKAVLLHEVLTELIIAYNLVDLLKELKRYAETRLGMDFGLETRNAGQLRQFLDENDMHVKYVMTPMNPLGYQMAPSKEDAEKAIEDLADRGTKIIAINVLASGTIPPENACEYLSKFKSKIYAVAYGTSKPSRAKENALLLVKYLS